MLKRDDALRTVVRFTTEKSISYIENGVSKVKTIVNIGTGVFFYRDNVQTRLYIVTANHVTKEFTANTQVEMMGQNNSVLKVSLSSLQNGKQIINHPTADLSAVEVDVNIFNSLNSNVSIFGTSLINPSIITNISRDAELTSIGFPQGLGISNLFEPLTFRSFPSSNLIKNLSGLDGGYVSDVFLLENPSCGGYSGGPVIDLGYIVSSAFTQSAPTYFYGIMHGTISDNTGGKIAVVTPATYILQLI